MEAAMPAIKPVPDGYPSLTPYLIVRDGAAAIAFYEKALGARLRLKLDAPGGRIGHAELEIGDSVVMLADEHPEIGARGPQAFGGSPVGLHLYIEEVDAVVARAVAAGATLVHPVENKFYGDRMGTIEDPFGHRWYVTTHIEDVPPNEIARRAAALGRGEHS
jgi:PhnB protein